MFLYVTLLPELISGNIAVASSKAVQCPPLQALPSVYQALPTIPALPSSAELITYPGFQVPKGLHTCAWADGLVALR